LSFVKTLTDRPIKVALPGPYLLTRLLWLDCLKRRPYETREALAEDVVRILRAELFHLLAGGAIIVQLDEPGLTEVVHGRPPPISGGTTTALAVRHDSDAEQTFASGVINRVVAGAPRNRVAIHVCRGSSGSYSPILPLLRTLQVGTYFLELANQRPGEMGVLRGLPETCRIGVGVVDPKLSEVESVATVYSRADQAAAMFGPDRVLLTPDCGFSPYAARPVSTAASAEAKMGVVVQAARILRRNAASGLAANR
jgi:5-methyltetrahydropteroyltriglutamate--homocysteine methyltransferase